MRMGPEYVGSEFVKTEFQELMTFMLNPRDLQHGHLGAAENLHVQVGYVFQICLMRGH